MNRAAEEVGLKSVSTAGKGNIIWVERPVLSEELATLAVLQVRRFACFSYVLTDCVLCGCRK